MFLSVIVSSSSQMLLKTSANKKYDSFVKEYLNLNVFLGYSMMLISTLLVIYAYKGIEMKNGTVIESLGYVFVMVLSNIFFKEKITKTKLIGNCIILLGILIFYL